MPLRLKEVDLGNHGLKGNNGVEVLSLPVMDFIERLLVDPLNPPPHASESEPDNEIEVENPIEHEDETVLVSVYVVWLKYGCGRGRTGSIWSRRKGEERITFYGKLILDLGNEVRSSVEQGTVAMEKLVEKLGNTEDRVECKKLKKELEEARFSNTFLHMQNERVERDLYWTRVRAHDF
ncbi:hypothetical protein Tco_0806778 [Tanacetum coccineum]